LIRRDGTKSDAQFPLALVSACGENIHRVYNDNRFDQAYNFRKAYNEATKLRVKQDEWCKVGAANKEPFPEDLAQEALVDVLRGKVKVNVHCYETVDFDQLVSSLSLRRLLCRNRMSDADLARSVGCVLLIQVRLTNESVQIPLVVRGNEERSCC
jgi:hypothetical protein